MQRITDEANRISGFDALPVTAQVSLLYNLIAEAQSHGIPLRMICKAMNDGGSSVTERYLREALFQVRKKREARGESTDTTLPVQVEKSASAQAPTKPVKTGSEGSSGHTPKQQRETKAQSYMDNSNPLLKQLKKD
ncbi:hypothetical protein ACN99C_26680 (plasmid) [Pseudomonas alloputida]|uniref:hypothetical protein n=1 Tax=Pseudomonas alloputida TaxID=1940621 RepID=UPI003B43220C